MKLLGDVEWHLVQRPMASTANEPSPLPRDGAAGRAVAALSRDPPPPGGVPAVLAGDQAGRLIHPDEFMLAADVLRSRDDASQWEVLSSSPKTGFSLKRRAKEPPGPVTIMIEATVKGIPMELAADVLSNFTRRSEWDKQQVNFQTHDDWGCPASHANGLFYFSLHIPPLADRDFVNYFALARAADGSGYMTFARDGEHPSYPAGHEGRIRAQLHGNVMYMFRPPEDLGSSRFVMITKQDIKLAVIPYWLINVCVPHELGRWKNRLQAQCELRLKQHRASGSKFPLADLFSPSWVQLEPISSSAMPAVPATAEPGSREAHPMSCEVESVSREAEVLVLQAKPEVGSKAAQIPPAQKLYQQHSEPADAPRVVERQSAIEEKFTDDAPPEVTAIESPRAERPSSWFSCATRCCR